MADYDPAAIRVQPAATVMLIRDRPDIEVLLLRRNTRSVFVGDMWVFPGGGVDEADRDQALYPRVRGLNLTEAVKRLETDDAPAYWIAAIRETFEEAGVLVAVDGSGAALDQSDLASDANLGWRDRLNNGSISMRKLVDETGYALDGSQFEYAARFITPVGPRRRYDARFFVAQMPENQVASVDNDEAVSHTWIRPTDAIDQHQRGAMAMMTPTLACLRRLTRYSKSSEAIGIAHSGSVNEPMRVELDSDGANRIVFADEPGYDSADQVAEPGWMRF